MSLAGLFLTDALMAFVTTVTGCFDPATDGGGRIQATSVESTSVLVLGFVTITSILVLDNH